MAFIPALADLTPPVVLGAAALTTRAFHGESLEALAGLVARHRDHAARLHDQALLATLGFQHERAKSLRAQAVAQSRLFRTSRAKPGRLKVLAVMVPGDLMANTPLDFMLQEQDANLDLLYHLPGQALPEVVPEHDVAVFAAADPDAALCAELQALYESWPRPAFNRPGSIPVLERDALSARLAGIRGICSPPTVLMTRAELQQGLDFSIGAWLVRPAGTHAGHGLARIATPEDLSKHLQQIAGERFYVTRFIGYAGPDGRYRKYRIAFIGGRPFLCHMAVSSHWMIHYLNAGMTDDVFKRAEEAGEMVGFSTGFAARHRAALKSLDEVIALDYHAVDCAETADGKLLVFEADNAAIIHMMDPPELFPYKRPQMQTIFSAFFAALQSKAATRELHYSYA